MTIFRPLVSIAVITYNQKTLLKDCLDSCFAQSYQNIEIIVADDSSTDATRDLLTYYKDISPFAFDVYIGSENRGVAANCNRAWKACRGEWIKTIAGDDKLEPNCIEIFINHISKDEPKADLYFSHMICEESGDRVYCDVNFYGLSNKDKITSLCNENAAMLAPTSFIRKSILHKVGYADERFPMIEDYPLWLTFLKKNATIKFIDQCTVRYRKSTGITFSKNPSITASYLASVIGFQKSVLWPEYKGFQNLKIVDDLVFYIINLSILRLFLLIRLNFSLRTKNIVLFLSPYYLSRLLTKMLSRKLRAKFGSFGH